MSETWTCRCGKPGTPRPHLTGVFCDDCHAAVARRILAAIAAASEAKTAPSPPPAPSPYLTALLGRDVDGGGSGVESEDTMNEHTKAPWRYFYDQNISCWVVKSAPCQVNGSFMEDGYTIGCFAFEADARLIAGAPDMLEKLETIPNLLRTLDAREWANEIDELLGKINMPKGGEPA